MRVATVFAWSGVGEGRVIGAGTDNDVKSLGVFSRSKDAYEGGCDVFGIEP